MAEYRAPDGPHWMPAPRVGDLQRDGRGVLWVVTRVERGGRIIHWETDMEIPRRVAKTEITASHPAYPSDAFVLQWEREQKRNAIPTYWF